MSLRARVAVAVAASVWMSLAVAVMIVRAAGGLTDALPLGGLVVAGAGATVTALALTSLLVARAFSPLRRLHEVAETAVVSGEGPAQIKGDWGNDEAGRLAASFNRVVTRLEAMVHDQKRLLADTSHELRNPLTVIRTNIDMLGKPLDEATRREVADETEREVVRMIALVEDLTLLARTENVRPTRMAPVRLDRLAREAVERLRPIAGTRTFEIVETEPAPVVLGDEDRLRQVLINLLGNAVRYTGVQGRIVVEVAREEGVAVLRVRDDGVGMAPEHLPHVFERFYRADPSRGRATGGSGLGLAIVKALAEAHGGKVEVESALGQGAIFTVRLPLENGEAARVTRPMPGVRGASSIAGDA